MMKFLYVVSHPIQVHTPIFRKLSQSNKIAFKVIYWQNISKNFFDIQFNTTINFGMNLTSGFNHLFLSEQERQHVRTSFIFKLQTLFKLIKLIRTENYQAICFHGYAYPHLFAAIVSKLMKKKTIMRDISNNLGRRKNLLKKTLRFFYYKFANLFIDEFWAIGKLNTSFFETYGANKKNIKLIPHVTDNERLMIKNNPALIDREKIYLKYNLLLNKKIVLYTGKFYEQKQPLMLMESFINAKFNDEWLLVLVGDGISKNDMELYIQSKKLDNIKIVGFLNQNEIVNLYNVAEIFVLPTKFFETWGLSAIEAAQSGCALIVSDIVGCHPEVLSEKMGLVFDNRDMNELSRVLKLLMSDHKMREKFKQNALKYSRNNSIQITAEKIIETLQ